jgi:hypothetical protein
MFGVQSFILGIGDWEIRDWGNVNNPIKSRIRAFQKECQEFVFAFLSELGFIRLMDF